MATQYAFGQIVTSGLVLALNAADPNSYPGSGTTWRDISGNNNTGTLTNGPTFDSANGGSIVFDGSNDFVQFGSISRLQFTNTQPYTISSWIYWTPVGSNITNIVCYGRVVGASPNVGDQGYYLALDSGVLRSNSFLFDYYDGSNSISIQGNINTISTNSWINIVGINNGSNNTSGMSVYINSVLSSYTSRINLSPTSINYTNCNVNIAARDSKATMNGRVAQTLIYNRTLTAQEISQNYNATRTRFGL